MASKVSREQIKELVKSVKKYGGFRQMAEYNIQCLLSHILPPAMGWRENVQAAVEDGGIDSIIHVLAKHGNALDLVRNATTALTGMATTKENAGKVAEGGGIETALNSMLNISSDTSDGKEVVDSGAKLLETVARYNPESIAKSANGVKSVLKGLNFDESARVQTASAKVLDRVAMKKPGEDMIVQQNGIDMLVSAISPGKATHEGMLTSTFRLMERLAKNDDYIIRIRELGGVEALVSQLEAHSDNEYILRAGGRLLAKIASGDIKGALDRLMRADLSDEVRNFTMGLIANLALQPDKIDEIVKNDGIKVILSNFDKYNPKTQAAALRAIQRVADSSKQNAQEIVNAGGIPILIKAIQNADGNEDILKAAVNALSAIATAHPDFAKMIEDSGGIKAILDAMKSNPNLEGFSLAALDFLSKLADSGYDTSKMLASGAIPATLSAMQNNPDSPEVQSAGFKALKSLMNTKDDSNNATAAQQILKANGAAIMVPSLSNHADNDAVVKNGIGAFAKLIENDPKNGKKHVVASRGVEALVDAIFTQLKLEMLGKSRLGHAQDYTRDVRSLLDSLVDDKEVKGVPKTLTSPRDEAELESGLKKAAVFAVDPGFASLLTKADVHKALPRCINGIVNGSSSNKEELMETSDVAVWSLGKSSYGTAVDLMESGAVGSVLDGVKQLPAQADSTNAGLRAMVVFANAGDCKEALSEKGGIETSIVGMRSNSDDPEVQLSAMELLLALCSNDNLSAKVVHKGGVRQINAMVINSSQNVEFEKPIEKSLELVNRISTLNKDSKMSNQLKKQGTIDAASIAMSSFPSNEKILEHGAQILSNLMNKEDVANVIKQVDDLSNKLEKTRPEKQGEVFNSLARNNATAGFLSMNPEFKEVFRKNNGANVVMKAVKQSVEQNQTNPRQVAVRNGFRAFGAIASATDVPNGTAEQLAKYLKAPEEQIAVHEKVGVLEAIKKLAEDGPARNTYLKLNAVDDILNLLNDNRNDEAMALASINALRSLMADPQGLKMATESGALDSLLDLLRSNNENMSPQLAAVTLDALRDLAKNKANLDALMDSGVVDLVMNAIDTHCDDPADPQPEVLRAAADLLNTLGDSEDHIRQIVQKGALEKIILAAQKNPAYLEDADTMAAVANLTDSALSVDDLRDKILESGAVPMLLAAMNFNPDNAKLQDVGSNALQKLIGGNNQQGLAQTLKEYDDLLKKTSQNPKPIAVKRLNDAAHNLGNLMLLDDVISGDNAADIVDRALNTYDVAKKKIPDGPMKSALLENALQTVGRAPNIENALDKMDIDRALKALTDALDSDNPMILNQALNAITKMVNEKPELISGLAKTGAIKAIEDIIHNSTNPEVKAAAQRAMKEVKDAVAARPDALLNAANADESLISIIKTQSPEDLDKLLELLAQRPGGMEHLLGLLTNPDLSDGFKMDLLDRLQDLSDDKLVLPPGMLPALIDKLKNGNEKEQMKAMKIIGASKLTPQSARSLMENNTAEDLLNIIRNGDSKDPNAALEAMRALGAMAAADPKLAEQLNDMGAIEDLLRFMEDNKNNGDVQLAGFEALRNLEKNVPDGKLKLNPAQITFLEDQLDVLKDDNRDMGKNLIDKLHDQYAGEPAAMVVSRFDKMLENMKDGDQWRELYDKNGRPYYYNEKTKETTWDKPAALVALDSAAEQLAEYAADAPADINFDGMDAAVNHFDKHAAEPLRLKALAKALAALAANEANMDAMARAGVLKAIIKAMNGKDTDRDFLLAAIALLNQFAKKKHYKEQICKLGGIRALIAIMLRYIDDQEIVEKCLICLSNLSYQSKMCSDEIMVCKGPQAVKKVIGRWRDDAPVLTNSMIMIKNVMHGNDEYKDTVGSVLRTEVVQTLRAHYKDKKVFDATAKALGTICHIDEHTFWVTSKSTVKTLVAAMNKHHNDNSVQKISVDVMGNIAAADEEIIQDKIDRGEIQSVLRTIEFEGGAKKIVDTFKQSEDPPLLASCIRTLATIAENDTLINPLIKMGVASLSLEAMEKYDYDEDISLCSSELIKFITEHDIGIDTVEKEDGVSILTRRLEACIDQPEHLEALTYALKNMSKIPRIRRDIFKQGGVETVINVMNANRTEKDFILQACELLSRLSIKDEEISHNIATTGMHVILNVINKNAKDPEVLTAAFQLLGHLAFTKSNLKILVQYGGIKLVFNALLLFPNQKELVLKSVQTLDNVASGSPDYAKVVIEESGGRVVEALTMLGGDSGKTGGKKVEGIYEKGKLKYDDKAIEIVNACRAAKIALKQLKQRKAKEKYVFGDRHDVADPTIDPLSDFRNTLKQGSIFTDWSSGAAKKRHVKISSNWQSIEFKDPSKGKVVVAIGLSDFRGVRAGIQSGHKKKAKPAAAFALNTASKTFFLEARNSDEKEQWVSALLALHDTFRTNKRWLKAL